MAGNAEQKGAIAQQSGASVEEPLPARPGCGREAADSFDVTDSLRDGPLQPFEERR